MVKQYSFLNEGVLPWAVGAAAVAAGAPISATLGTIGLGMGAIGTIKNIGQNKVNNKYLDLMSKELYNCKDRQQALQVLNRYTNQLTSMYNKMDKKTVNKIAIVQNFLKINFKIPLTKIINNSQDVNWKQNVLTFIKTNKRKINTKNTIRTGVTATSLAAGGALMSGIGGTVAASVASSTFLLNTAVKQLKIFNSTKYLNSMIKELEQCPDNNRQLAVQILERYCYDISNNIQTIVNKSQKKINFDIQEQMRSRFLVPCLQIINNTNNNYWKMSLMDYIKSEKLQGIIQHICDSITQLLIPRLIGMRRGANMVNQQAPVMRR